LSDKKYSGEQLDLSTLTDSQKDTSLKSSQMQVTSLIASKKKGKTPTRVLSFKNRLTPFALTVPDRTPIAQSKFKIPRLLAGKKLSNTIVPSMTDLQSKSPESSFMRLKFHDCFSYDSKSCLGAVSSFSTNKRM